MSEFDDSPAALEEIRKANRRVRRWRDDCEGHADELKNPFVGTVRASSYASSGSSSSSSSSAAPTPWEVHERGWPTTHVRDWHPDGYGYNGGAYGGDKFPTSRNVPSPVVLSPSGHHQQLPRFPNGVASPQSFSPPAPCSPHPFPTVIPGSLAPSSRSHGAFSPEGYSHQWSYSASSPNTHHPDCSGRSRTVLHRDFAQNQHRSQSQYPSRQRRGQSRSRERDHHRREHGSSSSHRRHRSSSHHRRHQHYQPLFPVVPSSSPTSHRHHVPALVSSPTSQVYPVTGVHPSITTAPYQSSVPASTHAYTHPQAPRIVVPEGYQVVQHRHPPLSTHSPSWTSPGFGHAHGVDNSASRSSWLKRLKINPFSGKDGHSPQPDVRGGSGVRHQGEKRHQLVKMRRRSGTL